MAKASAAISDQPELEADSVYIKKFSNTFLKLCLIWPGWLLITINPSIRKAEAKLFEASLNSTVSYSHPGLE